MRWPNIAIKIRERDYDHCQICEKFPDRRAFPVHHIDFNKENNADDNLITLCVQCHKDAHSGKHTQIYLVNLARFGVIRPQQMRLL